MKNKEHKKAASTKQTKRGLNKSVLIRCGMVFTAFVLAGGVLTWQLSRLQVAEAATWQARADDQQLQSTEITPVRGVIYDSEMRPLAENSTVWTVESYPNVMAQSRLTEEGQMAAAGENDAEKAYKIAAQKLAEILGLDEATLLEKLGDAESKYYRVKARIEKPEADAIREMVTQYGVRGIRLIEDSQRYYPYEDLAAPVLGFLNSDGDGNEGLEYKYNDVLAGTPGRLITAYNATGGVMPFDDNSVTYEAKDGNNLVLTMNADVQQSLEKNLAAAVARYSAAERGMGIVMDVNTGAILAMATEPDYNPNDPYYIYDTPTREAVEAMPANTDEEAKAKSDAQGVARIKQWRNKTVSDTYEPGSVFKVITAAAALDSGTATPQTGYYCNGKYMVEGWPDPFGCAAGKVHNHLSLENALIESCNISFIQIAQQTGLNTWYNYLHGFGLTEPTGVDLPGEPSQQALNVVVYPENKMGPVELASTSFGQSNKYSALQMITAASAAVNGGKLVQPHIVDKIIDNQGNVVQQFSAQPKRQVISAETSAELSDILEKLVSDPTGYGKNAKVAGYSVGGKSGTSQKLEIMQKEDREVYISSFWAFAPADDPQIAVLIVLDEPQDPEMGNYFGGRLAGPTAGSVMGDALKIMGIEPEYTADDLSRSTIAVPNVTGLELQKANEQLGAEGLNYRTIGGGGAVTGQSPQAGTQIPRGGQVILYTADEAAQTAKVPDLNAKTAKDAIETLKNLGFNVLTTGAPDNGTGVVVDSQNVAVDTHLPLGTVITLTLRDMSASADL